MTGLKQVVISLKKNKGSKLNLCMSSRSEARCTNVTSACFNCTSCHGFPVAVEMRQCRSNDAWMLSNVDYLLRLTSAVLLSVAFFFFNWKNLVAGDSDSSDICQRELSLLSRWYHSQTNFSRYVMGKCLPYVPHLWPTQEYYHYGFFTECWKHSENATLEYACLNFGLSCWSKKGSTLLHFCNTC